MDQFKAKLALKVKQEQVKKALQMEIRNTFQPKKLDSDSKKNLSDKFEGKYVSIQDVNNINPDSENEKDEEEDEEEEKSEDEESQKDDKHSSNEDEHEEESDDHEEEQEKEHGHKEEEDGHIEEEKGHGGGHGHAEEGHGGGHGHAEEGHGHGHGHGHEKPSPKEKTPEKKVEPEIVKPYNNFPRVLDHVHFRPQYNDNREYLGMTFQPQTRFKKKEFVTFQRYVYQALANKVKSLNMEKKKKVEEEQRLLDANKDEQTMQGGRFQKKTKNQSKEKKKIKKKTPKTPKGKKEEAGDDEEPLQDKNKDEAVDPDATAVFGKEVEGSENDPRAQEKKDIEEAKANLRLDEYISNENKTFLDLIQSKYKSSENVEKRCCFAKENGGHCHHNDFLHSIEHNSSIRVDHQKQLDQHLKSLERAKVFHKKKPEPLENLMHTKDIECCFREAPHSFPQNQTPEYFEIYKPQNLLYPMCYDHMKEIEVFKRRRVEKHAIDSQVNFLFLKSLVDDEEEEIVIRHYPFPPKNPRELSRQERMRRWCGIMEWTDRTMLQQIWIQIVGVFSCFTFVVVIMFIVGVLVYKYLILRSTERVLRIMTDEFHNEMLNTVANQVNFMFDIEQQLSE